MRLQRVKRAGLTRGALFTLPPPALTHQAVILCAFNGADALAYPEVRELSGLSDDKELKRNLMSLSVGKVGLGASGLIG